jgi:L-histidine N-alpha-methyltransferase
VPKSKEQNKEVDSGQFNINVPHRMNQEFDANFDVSQFRHHAFYDEGLRRSEMHLVSRCRQQVLMADRVFSFTEGEGIHAENACKCTVEEFQNLAEQAGFKGEKVWHDPDRLFSIHHLTPA